MNFLFLMRNNVDGMKLQNKGRARAKEVKKDSPIE